MSRPVDAGRPVALNLYLLPWEPLQSHEVCLVMGKAVASPIPVGFCCSRCRWIALVVLYPTSMGLAMVSLRVKEISRASTCRSSMAAVALIAFFSPQYRFELRY